MSSVAFKIAFLIVVAAVVAGWFWLRAGTAPGADARALVRDGALLVDVRSPEEYAAGHIDGAVNIPVGELKTRLGELGDKQRSIVLYCRSGARSAKAKTLLESTGFTSVVNLGAMSSWPE
ncbi:MAG TPA: rhodanese-like domain-containing protein [Polyangiaceae bacterium]|nr:rhodanese-like domain-containing protein [Polyangiaceae bacterium]